MDILEFSLQLCQEQKNLQEIVMTQEKKKKSGVTLAINIIIRSKKHLCPIYSLKIEC